MIYHELSFKPFDVSFSTIFQRAENWCHGAGRKQLTFLGYLFIFKKKLSVFEEGN
jgi:hypothetical protein